MNKPSSGYKKKTTTILKWIGVVSTLIGLIIGISQLSGLFSKWRESGNRVEELINNSRLQSASADYPGAWNTLEQALAVKPDSKKVQAEQAALAILWLRNIRVKGETTFSSIVDKLLPALYNAANTSKGQARADALAYIGWGNYLKYRDGIRDIKVSACFKEAIAEDSLNVYAHAMWGFWMLLNEGGELNREEAEKQFSLALKSGRDAVYIRHLHLSALNHGFEYSYEPKIFLAVNDIRKHGDTLSMYERNTILSYAYAFEKRNLDSIAAVLSPKDHLQTFLYLADGINFNEHPYLKFANARLVENTGDVPKALSMYRAIYSDSTLKQYERRGEVKSAIDRLTLR